MPLNPVPNYPSGGLDSLPDPTTAQYEDDDGFEIDLLLQKHNAILEALENELGAAPVAGDSLPYVRISDGAGKGIWVPSGALTIPNPIVNANFPIWQDGATFTSIANGTYGPDNWVYITTSAAVHDLLRSTDVPAVAVNAALSNYSCHLDVTTVDASIAAGDITVLATRIEGETWLAFAQRQFSLGFWVKAAKTGVHCVSFVNSGADRSYIGTYTVNVADTWEWKSITVSASPSAGTWNYTTGIGLRIGWALACGSTFQTTAGAWQTGNFLGTSAQVNELDNAANNFRIYGARMNLGPHALPFAPRPIGIEQALCKRYYQKSYTDGVAPAAASTVGMKKHQFSDNDTSKIISVPVPLSPEMRTTPTVTLYDAAGNSAKISTYVAAGTKTDNVSASTGAEDQATTGFTVRHSGTVAGIGFHYKALARL